VLGGLGANSPELRRAGRENSAVRLLVPTWVFTDRILRRWSRDPTMAETLLVPIAFLVTMNIVLGDGISQVTGHSALYGSVPLVAMVTAMQGATVGGLGVMRERGDGLLSRLWVLLVHRASGVLSRLVAEAVRILSASVVLMCAGLVLGFRFREGIPSAVAWLAVPAVFGIAISVAVMTIALYSAKTIVLEATAVISGLLMFFSTGFVPLDQYPR
jgi:ABC-2 type transport system permease protein